MRVTVYRVETPTIAGYPVYEDIDALAFDSLIEVDSGTTEGCIEEYGRCDGVSRNDLDFVAVPVGEAYPGPWMPDRAEQGD
jgi:hypothetical protein